MNTLQIEDILSRLFSHYEALTQVKYCDFLGVFAADQVPYPTLFPHSTSQFNYSVPPSPRRICFVINTDPSTKEGSHWTACFLDYTLTSYQSAYSVEFFDSYGLPPTYHNFHFPDFTKSNNLCLQALNTSVCGEYCILYLTLKCCSLYRKLLLHSLYPANKSLSIEQISSGLYNLATSNSTRDKIVKSLITKLLAHLPKAPNSFSLPSFTSPLTSFSACPAYMIADCRIKQTHFIYFNR